ncbi:MAG: hypothetical protein ABIO57_03250 [Candidatus Paceibacterota bacterium]
MKKILAAIILVLSLVSILPTAQAADSCQPVTSANYQSCCVQSVGGEGVAANSMQCSEYEKANPTTTTTTPATTNTAISCSNVTNDNYSTCCYGANSYTYADACANRAPSTTTAQTQSSCATITDGNASTCCTNATTDTMVAACQQYYYYNPSATSQQVGGSQTTNPLNGGSSTAYNTGSGAGLAATATDMQAAQSCSAKFKTLLDIAIWAKCIIGAVIIPGIFTLAFVVFLWGVFKFIRSSEQKDKQESKQFIYMGLIGLFVMVSVWGIIKIATTTLGLDNTVPVLQTDYLSNSKASK